MKVFGKFFYLRLIYSFYLLTILNLDFSFSQTQEWIGLYKWEKILDCLAQEGQYLWVGTAGGGLV
jgi:hypothetical protein